MRNLHLEKLVIFSLFLSFCKNGRTMDGHNGRTKYPTMDGQIWVVRGRIRGGKMPFFVLNVLKNGGISGAKYPPFFEFSAAKCR